MHAPDSFGERTPVSTKILEVLSYLLCFVEQTVMFLLSRFNGTVLFMSQYSIMEFTRNLSVIVDDICKYSVSSHHTSSDTERKETNPIAWEQSGRGERKRWL